MNRRQFLKNASALALAAHEGLALSSPKNATRIANNAAPRLLRLRLLTAAPLAKMKSFFFWDPAGNLIEYIARHDLKNSAAGAFSAKDFLYASEIAFISEDVTHTALEMRKALQLEQYRGGDDRFRALGDEHGLLLVIIRGRRWGYEEKAPPTGIFPTVVTIRGANPAQFTIADYPYEIFVK